MPDLSVALSVAVKSVTDLQFRGYCKTATKDSSISNPSVIFPIILTHFLLYLPLSFLFFFFYSSLSLHVLLSFCTLFVTQVISQLITMFHLRQLQFLVIRLHKQSNNKLYIMIDNFFYFSNHTLWKTIFYTKSYVMKNYLLYQNS